MIRENKPEYSNQQNVRFDNIVNYSAYRFQGCLRTSYLARHRCDLKRNNLSKDKSMDVLSITYLRDAPPITVPLIHVVVIILFAWLLSRISRKLIRTFRIHMERRAATAENIRRIDTLANVFRYVISLLVTLPV